MFADTSRQFAVLLGMLFLLSSSGFAQDQNVDKLPDPVTDVAAIDSGAQMLVQRVGLIDIEGVLRSSTGTQRVRELLDEQRLAFQKEIGVKELELQSIERELLANQPGLSKEEFDTQIADFQARVTELQKQIQYRRQALDVAFHNAQNDLSALALEIVKTIATEKDLDLVLVKDSVLIFVPSLNISDEVLRRLNERTKNARIEIKINETNFGE